MIGGKDRRRGRRGNGRRGREKIFFHLNVEKWRENKGRK